MTRLEQALRILSDEFDAFVIIGSIYNPASGKTSVSRILRGNVFTIEGMMNNEFNGTLMDNREEEEVEHGEEERDG